jgi:hypothetical protein
MASTTSFVRTVEALVAHRDELFLKRLAEEYKLDLAELCAKFLEVPVAKEKKKRAIKVKLTSDGKEIRCQGFTAKKEQCSFGPLPGQCFCKRHMPASAAPAAPEEPEAQGPNPLTPIPEEPAEPEAPAPFTVPEEDKVGFDQLTPLTPAKSPEGTPCNLWAKLEEVQAEAEQAELDRELTRRQALEKEHEDMLAALRKTEKEHEDMLAALRKAEQEAVQEAMEELGIELEPGQVPYEPPVCTPSPKKAPKRRQSMRPKVAKK